ncbi:MAG TPA: hypothetical protein VFB20_05475 [Burkholderiales bacterium]|nr:hypothetical protein [Burkholderiales bacterium]
MRSLTLFIGDLLAAVSQPPDVRLRDFEFLIARSACEFVDADPAGWMCARFGVARQRDWPVAALLARAADLPSEDVYWLCADPVHLDPQHDGALLLPPASLQLTPEESRRLVNDLNRHFASQGESWFDLTPTRWLLRSSRPAGICTVPMDAAREGRAEPLLPAGEDAPAWAGLLTEAQMLLHAHPVNEAREARGLPSVNSVWLWGGGTVPEVPRHDIVVAGADCLARALALAGRCSVAADFDAVLEAMGGGSAEALVAQTEGAADAAGALVVIERQWLAPALRALSDGCLDFVQLAARAGHGVAQWRLARNARWLWWRRPRPLRAQLESIGRRFG